jgi:histidinol-phosphate aminotransferase
MVDRGYRRPNNGELAWVRDVVSATPAPASPGTAADFKTSAAQPLLLHLNESPYPASPAVGTAMRAALDDLNRYPDPLAAPLTTALSHRTGISPDRIVIGAGSEELVKCLIDAALDPNDEIVVPAPSWPVYEAAIRLRHGKAVRASLDQSGANDADALLNAIGQNTRIVVCCTPNPPTGGMMRADALRRLIADVPNHLLLVVDEAYHEFAKHAGGPDVLVLLSERGGPWVCLRTFSKAYGLAALRVGYALCGSLSVAQTLNKLKLTYSPPTIAQAAALAALGDDAHLKKTISAIAREAQRLSHGLAELGLKVWPTAANFVSVTLPIPAKAMVGELRQAGILVRDWRDREFPNEIRITVGRPEDTDLILKVLPGILQSQCSPEMLQRAVR